MTGNMFDLKYGVLVAIDASRKDQVNTMVEAGEELYGVVGYKLGNLAVLENGMPEVMGMIRKMTDKPILLDWQKLVPDYPLGDPIKEALTESAQDIARIFYDSMIQGAVIYPARTARDTLPQTIFTNEMKERGIEPFVVGRFTYQQLKREGGHMPDVLPEMIYEQAAREDVEYFIMPGNRPEEVEVFMDIVLDNMPEPKPNIPMPGFGDQGGSIKEAFRATGGYPSYAIVGPVDGIDISSIDRIKECLKPYCDEALGFI